MATNISASPPFRPWVSKVAGWPEDTTRATPAIASTQPNTAPRLSAWPSMAVDRPSTIMGVSEPIRPMCVADVMWAA